MLLSKAKMGILEPTGDVHLLIDTGNNSRIAVGIFFMVHFNAGITIHAVIHFVIGSITHFRQDITLEAFFTNGV